MKKSLVHGMLALLLSIASFISTHGFVPNRRVHIKFSQFNRAKYVSLFSSSNNSNPCRILLLDHLNINHQKGQHDALKAFYFSFLKCSVDPRKYDNYLAGTKTVWANLGMHQFHLPEGKPDAQVLDGVITLVHENLDGLIQRYSDFSNGSEEFAALRDTEFQLEVEQDQDGMMLMVTDPWGNLFCILPTEDAEQDRAESLGSQPNLEGALKSEGLKMEDLTIYVSDGSNLEGITRFYDHIFGAKSIEELQTDTSVSIAIGDGQTLTFQYHPDRRIKVKHEDLNFDTVDEDGFPSNFGPHVSMYVSNLSHAYRMADELNVLYVNPRFKRRAYTEDEAIDQCMFRILDIIDPLDKQKGVIVSLEHEIRAVKTRNGEKYKSCPLTNVDL